MNKSMLRRILLIMCAFCMLFTLLGAGLFHIQITRHEELQAKAIDIQTRDTTITASRGTIYDCNGEILAQSASVETVFIDPYELRSYKENAELIASGLSGILTVDYGKLYEMTQKTGSRYQTVKRKIEAEEAALVRTFIKENSVKSIHLEADTKRYYPHGSLAAQVIGFVGTDNTGLGGIEASYDTELTGVNGRVIRLKNGSGTEMLFNDYENYFDSADGRDITLTIDATIQRYVEKHLWQAVVDLQVKSGAACIAIDPRNGEIKALASYGATGGYNLNDPWGLPEDLLAELALVADDPATEVNEQANAKSDAQYAQWRNKALSDTYEPGSVFKTITLAIALEEGLVNESSTFYCGGTINNIPGRDIPLHCHKATGHGLQTLSEAVQNSCNIAFAEIGLRIGAEKFYKYVDAFGFRAKTGIDVSGEAGSIWWSDESFMNAKDKSSLASASFGQTFNITPIQMITGFAATINGGILYTPHLVKEITDNSTGLVTPVRPESVRQVVSEQTSERVRQMLENVVAIGSGKNAAVPGYRIGGKTGTSTKTSKEAATGEKEYIVSFCGAAPMDDPRLVILLLLDNPTRQAGVEIYGSTMAAPVVGNIFADVLPYLGIAPQLTEEQQREQNVSVPKLVGHTVTDAEKALRSARLEYTIVGDGGTVTAQLPAANATVSPSTKIIIYAGEEPPRNQSVTVPDLTGKTYAKAKTMLESSGLFIRSTGVPPNLTGAIVSVQSVAAGADAEFGSVIEVILVDNTVEGVF